MKAEKIFENRSLVIFTGFAIRIPQLGCSVKIVGILFLDLDHRFEPTGDFSMEV